MTPAARVQAAIELLDAIIASTHANGAAADTIIADGFRLRRYAGSSDRRAVREIIYSAIRTFGEVPQSGRSALVTLADADSELAAAFDGSGYGPAVITADEPRETARAMPTWLGGLIDPAAHQALLERAALDLRANRLKTTRDAMLAHFAGSTPISGLADGLRIDPPIAVENDAAWRDGLVEVQDAGSQHVVRMCAAQPGMTVVDLCAGGGGKTLGLAADMSNEGLLVACDTDRARLQRLAPRAARAGATIEVRLLDGGKEAAMLGDLAGLADVVLVDAPCTGSGTLRRNPEARWRITPERLDRALALQVHVLDLAVPLVKPGGALVYAVCSLIEAEGRAQIDGFVRRHAGWSVAEARTLKPQTDGTDGFFVARLVCAC